MAKRVVRYGQKKLQKSNSHKWIKPTHWVLKKPPNKPCSGLGKSTFVDLPFPMRFVTQNER
jgi:hypothetical protein